MLYAAVVALPDFIYMFDLEGRFIYSNPALSNLLERSPEQMVGLNFFDLQYPDPLATTLQVQIQEVIDSKAIVRAETHFEAATGPGEYEYIFAPIFNDQGDVIAVAGTTRNITERWRAEEALRESQQELRSEREKLRSLLEEIERLNTQLEERVHERTLQYQSINRELEGFTYSVSHDLRAPLRAIVSSSRILLDDFGAHVPEDARKELQRQAAAANKLANLIDDLLKLSRLNRQEIVKKTVDISAMAREVAQELVDHHLDNRCEFKVEEGLTVVADPATLQLLFANLLGNACKFSLPGGLVEVGKSEVEGDTIFWVRDQGVGFDMQFVDKIFLPFERLVSEQEYPGSGIGLANVKRIVERHGGRIWAESTLGDGTTFLFTLCGSGV